MTLLADVGPKIKILRLYYTVKKTAFQFRNRLWHVSRRWPRRVFTVRVQNAFCGIRILR